MDKSRQQFEEEFKKRVELPTSDIFKINDDTGEYYYMTPRQAWYWWQVSRENLEIELPEPFIANETWCYDEDLVNQALISSGVKIKDE